MRVFLTGASGYLGSLLVSRFSEMPEVSAITAIGLSTPSKPLPQKARYLHLDVRSKDLVTAMAGHDSVVHTAAVVLWPASMSRKDRDDININGVRNVAQAALANNVSKFIHASSMAAYDPVLSTGKCGISEESALGNGSSRFYYWNAKALAEQNLQQLLAGSRTSLTLLRPIYITGPGCTVTTQRYRENAVRFPGRNPRRQFIHEEDVAAAFVRALRTDMPGAYNVVPDDHIQLNDVWRIVNAKRVPVVPVWAACLFTWLKWRFFGSPVHSSWVEDMLVDFTGSNAKLRATGWEPRYTSEAALRTSL